MFNLAIVFQGPLFNVFISFRGATMPLFRSILGATDPSRGHHAHYAHYAQSFSSFPGAIRPSFFKALSATMPNLSIALGVF